MNLLPRPVVAHAEHGLGTLARGREADRAVRIRELGRVVEEVREHLLDSGQVGFQPERLLGEGDCEPVAALVDDRPGSLDRALHGTAQLDPLLAQLDLAAAEAGDVQQVVHQARENQNR